MKHTSTFEQFVTENRKNKPNTKKAVAKIQKVIKKQFDKIESETAKAKELSASPEVTDKMSASLAKMKVQLAQAEAQKQAVKQNIEIKKGQLRAAKDQEKAKKELEKATNEDFATDEPELEQIRQFAGSVQTLDDWLRSKIGETNPYKDTIMVNGPHKGEKDKSLPYQDFQNGKSDLIKNRHGRKDS